LYNFKNRHIISIRPIIILTICLLFTSNSSTTYLPKTLHTPTDHTLSRWLLSDSLTDVGIDDPLETTSAAVTGLHYLESGIPVKIVNAYLREAADRIGEKERIKFISCSSQDQGIVRARFIVINQKHTHCEIILQNGNISINKISDKDKGTIPTIIYGETLQKELIETVEEVFEWYSRTVEGEGKMDVLLVEKIQLEEQVHIRLTKKDLHGDRINKLTKNAISSRFIEEINERKAQADKYLEDARIQATEYLSRGKLNPDTYVSIIQLYELARNTYEIIAVATGYQEEVLIQQSNIHIECEQFRQQAVDPDVRPDFVVSIITSNRSTSLERLLKSILEELTLFPYGVDAHGRSTKIKLCVVDNSCDTSNTHKNKDIIKRFSKLMRLPIHYVDISGDAHPHNYTYPIQVAEKTSELLSSPTTLKCVLDDDVQIKNLVPLHNGQLGTRHIFPYFDKARTIMENPQIDEVDGGVTNADGATPFRTILSASIDLWHMLNVFSTLNPESKYDQGVDIRMYTVNYLFNPAQTGFVDKKLHPRLRIPQEGESLMVGDQFKIYCNQLESTKYGNRVGKIIVHHPPSYFIEQNGAPRIHTIPNEAVGGNRIARYGSTSSPFFAPPYMRRLHQIRSQILNKISVEGNSFFASLPLYHDRPAFHSELTDDAFIANMRKGLMSKIFNEAFGALLKKTAFSAAVCKTEGEKYRELFKNLQACIKEHYNKSDDSLRRELVALEKEIWIVYCQEMWGVIKNLLKQIDDAEYLTSTKYFWNNNPEYKEAVDQLRSCCTFLKYYYDPDGKFTSKLDRVFKIGEGEIIDQIIKDLLDTNIESLAEPLPVDFLQTNSEIIETPPAPKKGSLYWHARYTSKGHHSDEIISGLQKEIRQGNQKALYCALELLHSGKDLEQKLWQRLLIISVEDVGISDPEALRIVWELRNRYWKLPDKSKERLYVALSAVDYLVNAPKDRFNDEVYICHKLRWPNVNYAAELEKQLKTAIDSHNQQLALTACISLLRTGNETKALDIISSAAQERGEGFQSFYHTVFNLTNLITTEDKNLFIVHIVNHLCTYPSDTYKTSDITQRANLDIYRTFSPTEINHLQNSSFEIRNIYLDLHTQRGKALGRDFEFFILHSSRLKNENPARDRCYLEQILKTLGLDEKQKNHVEQKRDELFKQFKDEDFILKTGIKTLKNYLINMHINLNSLPKEGLSKHQIEEQLNNNIETLALKIAWYIERGLNIRYILENDTKDEKALTLLRTKLGTIAKELNIPRDKLLESVSKPHEGENVIKISLKNARNFENIEKFNDWEFVVVLTDDTTKMGVPIPSYTAAIAIGLSQAILRISAEKSSGDDNFQKFDSIDQTTKYLFFNRIKRIYQCYGVIEEDDDFKIDDLKFMVVGCSKNKLQWAKEYALPPIVKDLVDKINEIHEIIQNILRAA